MSQRKVHTKNRIDAGLQPLSFNPLTDNQKLVFDNFEHYDVISMTGLPGTGKTFLALYLAIMLMRSDTRFRQIIILRSDVSIRPTGFLPGTIEEKMQVHEAPYIKHVTKIFDNGTAYEILRKRNIIAFDSTAHIRGTEFNNAIVIVDEAQNMSWAELDAINTRFGDDCKLVFCGDVGQDNLTSKRYQEESGYAKMMEIHDRILDDVYTVEFDVDDIVRSGYIKKYILAQFGK